MTNDPATKEQYNERFAGNQRISGFGFETTMHVPCPFCAAPDWLVHRIIDTEAAYSRGAVCRHCDRGARAIVSHDHGGVEMRFVQTCGPDQPKWLMPAMPREAETT